MRGSEKLHETKTMENVLCSLVKSSKRLITVVGYEHELCIRTDAYAVMHANNEIWHFVWKMVKFLFFTDRHSHTFSLLNPTPIRSLSEVRRLHRSAEDSVQLMSSEWSWRGPWVLGLHFPPTWKLLNFASYVRYAIIVLTELKTCPTESSSWCDFETRLRTRSIVTWKFVSNVLRYI